MRIRYLKWDGLGYVDCQFCQSGLEKSLLQIIQTEKRPVLEAAYWIMYSCSCSTTATIKLSNKYCTYIYKGNFTYNLSNLDYLPTWFFFFFFPRFETIDSESNDILNICKETDFSNINFEPRHSQLIIIFGQMLD